MILSSARSSIEDRRERTISFLVNGMLINGLSSTLLTSLLKERIMTSNGEDIRLLRLRRVRCLVNFLN